MGRSSRLEITPWALLPKEGVPHPSALNMMESVWFCSKGNGTQNPNTGKGELGSAHPLSRRPHRSGVPRSAGCLSTHCEACRGDLDVPFWPRRSRRALTCLWPTRQTPRLLCVLVEDIFRKSLRRWIQRRDDVRTRGLPAAPAAPFPVPRPSAHLHTSRPRLPAGSGRSVVSRTQKRDTTLLPFCPARPLPADPRCPRLVAAWPSLGNSDPG